MSLKLANKDELNKYILAQSVNIEKALIYRLEAFVAELQNHAKLSAGYKDQTGNLKASIGGVLLNQGKPVSYAGFEETEEGSSIKSSADFLNSLISKYKKGYTILVVAGMEYASYVENYHGRNVLKKSELKMAKELPVLLENLKKQIK